MIPFKHKPAAGSHKNKTKPNILSVVLESQCALRKMLALSNDTWSLSHTRKKKKEATSIATSRSAKLLGSCAVYWLSSEAAVQHRLRENMWTSTNAGEWGPDVSQPTHLIERHLIFFFFLAHGQIRIKRTQTWHCWNGEWKKKRLSGTSHHHPPPQKANFILNFAGKHTLWHTNISIRSIE